MSKSILAFIVLFTVACGTSQKAPQELPAFSLKDVQKRSFLYFKETADPVTTLIPDRWPTPSFSSIAAQGFGYAAWIVGVENGWVSRQEAAGWVLKSLRYFKNLPQGPESEGKAGYRGFFYHFLEMKTGQRFKQVELSSIDTGLLMAGILTCMSYFDADNAVEAEIRKLAEELYLAVEWDWMYDKDKQALSMGWHPEKGFIPAWWIGYNEAMVLNIMAMASPTHPIPSQAWQSWVQPYLWADFMGYPHVNFGPLFGHQYSHMFIDFRGIQDEYMRSRGIDYFENSRRATLANRAYCLSVKDRFPHYNDSVWGLTACDGPRDTVVLHQGRELQIMGYSARGAAANYQVDDGTIAPTAAGGSIPFAPKECIAALRGMYNTYGSRIYDKYGFKDAFNPLFTYGKGNEQGWFDGDYLGIDQGPIVIQIQNYQNELIWNILKKNPYIIAGLRKAGFSGGWLEQAKP
ncbi:MAG: glucoamylase family protein [Bacteroidales bacterium]